MTRREILRASLGVLAVPSLALSAQGAGASDGAINVSLIRLIANPGDFDGRRLRLIGVLGAAGLDRGIGLYPSESDARNYILCNSIYLKTDSIEKGKHLGKYVIIVGTYHAPSPDNTMCSNGHIDKISTFKVYKYGDE